MRFSFTALIRMVLGLAVCINVMAICLARLSPVPGRSAIRQPAGPAPVGVYGHLSEQRDPRPRLIEPESGRLFTLDFADRTAFQDPAPSPWVDEEGERHVVGRWLERRGKGADSCLISCGVKRVAFPSGRELDLIPFTGPLPIGAVCWFPGTSTRILFAAGDGELYHFDLEAHREEPEARPARITWRTRPPGLGRVVMSNPTRPDLPELGGRVIVSLSSLQVVAGKVAFTDAELWWLQLDRDGIEIEEAGPLTIPGVDPAPPGESERSASFAKTDDGSMVAAYLSRGQRAAIWIMRVAPVVLDGETGRPTIDRTASRPVVQSLAVSPPAISSEGRWVSCLGVSDDGKDAVRRFLVEDILGPLSPRG